MQDGKGICTHHINYKGRSFMNNIQPSLSFSSTFSSLRMVLGGIYCKQYGPRSDLPLGKKSSNTSSAYSKTCVKRPPKIEKKGLNAKW